MGEKYGATAGQVAIAWVLAQGEDIIPIAGTTKIDVRYCRHTPRLGLYSLRLYYHYMQNLKENLGSLKVRLTPEDVAEVRKYADAANATVGDRYPRSLQHSLFIDTPPLQK